MGCRTNNNTGPKRYNILVRSNGGWWGFQHYVWADNADEAAESYVANIGINPPNEVAVQSTADSSKGAFKIYRIKPRAAYEIEVI